MVKARGMKTTADPIEHKNNVNVESTQLQRVNE